jgi:hypothetical protein
MMARGKWEGQEKGAWTSCWSKDIRVEKEDTRFFWGVRVVVRT